MNYESHHEVTPRNQTERVENEAFSDARFPLKFSCEITVTGVSVKNTDPSVL